MKAHSFTDRRGRPRAVIDNPGINNAVRAQQLRALGGEPYFDPISGLVVATAWRIDPDTGGRTEVTLDQPALAAWPLGVLYAKGLIGMTGLIAGGMHCWAHSVAFGRRSTVIRAQGEASVADGVGEGDGEHMGRVAMLGHIASEDEVCREAIERAYSKANALLMKRGAHIHGAINSLAIYEARPSWWLDTNKPEKTEGFRWTRSGVMVLERHWPSTIARLANLFLP